jgi:hypothetical protein
MKHSTALNLIHQRDELQRQLILQRAIIAQQLVSNPNTDEDQFPRSNTMRFLYSAKGLLLAQMIFKQVTGNHPRILSVMKTLGQLLLRKPG